MAHIEKTVLKRGGYSFRITACHNGKRYRKVVKFPESITERQAEKEAAKTAMQFEDELNSGQRLNYSLTLQDWMEEVLRRKNSFGRKKKTISGYRFCTRRINEFFDKAKLISISVTELTAFFNWLSKENLATATRYMKRGDVDLMEIIWNEQLAKASLAATARISQSTVANAVAGYNVTQRSAQKIADTLGYSLEELFVGCGDPKKLSEDTKDSYRRFLSIVFSTAYRDGIIPCNPMDRLERPIKEECREKPTLQPEEIQAVLSAVAQEPLDKQCLIHLFLITGCRRGEIAGIQWQWISWERSTVRIIKTIQYTPEDGVYEDSAKTRQTRLIRLPEDTMQLLQQYFTLQGSPADGYVFQDQQGGPISPETINGYIRRFRKKYDLVKLNPHLFRHTMASILIYAGQDIVSVSKRLGHSNVSTTQNTYSHLIEKADVESAEIIADAVLRGK